MAGHLRQRKSGSWECIVSAGRDPITGRPRYITRTVKGTKREADRVLAGLVLEAAENRDVDRRLTVAALWERWTQHHTPEWSPSTTHNLVRLYRQYIGGSLLARTPIAKVTMAQLEEYYAHLRRAGGHDGNPLAPTTVRMVAAYLRSMFADAQRWGLINTNPAALARSGRVPPSEIRPPDTADVRRLIEATAGTEFGTFIRLAAATGARRSQLLAVRWEDIDATGIRFWGAVVGVMGGLVVKSTKNGRSYRVSVDPGTITALEAHRTAMEARAEACGTELAPDSFVFSNDVAGRTPWSPSYATHAFGRARAKLGLTLRLHDLRHHHATVLLARGHGINTVSKRLGHANPTVTLSVYSHLMPEADTAAAADIGELLA